MAANVDNPRVSTLRLILVYLLIGLAPILFILCRTVSTVALGLKSSESLFSQHPYLSCTLIFLRLHTSGKNTQSGKYHKHKMLMSLLFDF